MGLGNTTMKMDSCLLKEIILKGKNKEYLNILKKMGNSKKEKLGEMVK